MALLLNAQGLSKSYGAAPLFENVALSISEGDRLGLIGPNGSGKSTLLEILAGRREPDTGEVAVRKGTRLGHVAQDPQFEPAQTVRSVIRRALALAAIPEVDRPAREAEVLGRSGFDDFDVEVSALSGGWRKRLAIAEALVQDPGILLLDEPTNHLDLAGIEWLEKLLESAAFACVVVSHDRYFLENVATEMSELNRVYPDGMLRVHGNYSRFLEVKCEFLHAQAKRQEALENRVRTEVEWLRRGPKARRTKAKARIDKAHEMIGELADLRARSRTEATDIDFTATDRKTKQLIELEQVRYGFGGRALYEGLDFVITAGMRVGLVGANGSGKTTLLRLLRGDIAPEAGEIRRAEALRIVYFDQVRQLDPDLSLRRALAPDSDSVTYRDRVIHVASWAARFLFSSEQLNQPIGRLSGGERARDPDREADARAGGCAAARRADQRPRHPDARDPRREPAGILRRTGAGDPRPLHAGSGFNGRAGARWTGWSGTFRRLFAMGRLADGTEASQGKGCTLRGDCAAPGTLEEEAFVS